MPWISLKNRRSFPDRPSSFLWGCKDTNFTQGHILSLLDARLNSWRRQLSNVIPEQNPHVPWGCFHPHHSPAPPYPVLHLPPSQCGSQEVTSNLLQTLSQEFQRSTVCLCHFIFKDNYKNIKKSQQLKNCHVSTSDFFLEWCQLTLTKNVIFVQQWQNSQDIKTAVKRSI